MLASASCDWPGDSVLLLQSMHGHTPGLTDRTVRGRYVQNRDLLMPQVLGNPALICLTLQLYGLLYVGPSAHYVHKLLDYLFEGKKDMNTAVKKVSLSPGCSLPSPGC